MNILLEKSTGCFSQRTTKTILDQVEVYLKDIKPETLYWKGKHTWVEMVDFRNNFTLKRSTSGFSAGDQKCILEWGGISRFTRFDLMNKGLVELSENNLSYNTYSRISSLSKLFSFYDPGKYFILDSRVALTINYLICEHETGDFYIPFKPYKSKGNKVKIALEKYNGEVMFENLGQAYIAYNSLILSIFKDIFIPNLLPEKPEIIEMAIFSIAKDISTGFQ